MRLLIRFGFAAFNARIESYVEEKIYNYSEYFKYTYTFDDTCWWVMLLIHWHSVRSYAFSRWINDFILCNNDCLGIFSN